MTGATSDSMFRIAVIGATGYLGGRLVSELIREGYHVRAVSRSFEKMRCRPYAASDRLEMARADACSEPELAAALRGCSACFWLINGLQRSDEPEACGLKAARNLVSSAHAAGLSRVIYLGPPCRDSRGDPKDAGNGSTDPGWILISGPVPVTWLRTAMIIGSGSASFEILRYLTERLPFMLAPQWMLNPIRPIAVSDVLRYLKGCLENPETTGLISDIGGPDVLSFRDLIDIYAEAAGLPRRLMVTWPIKAKAFSAYWINLVTPVPFGLARTVVENIDAGSAHLNDPVRRIVRFTPMHARDAVGIALQKVQLQEIESCWSDAGGLRPPEWLTCGDAGFAAGGVLDCSYRILLDCPPERVWKVLLSVGGKHGWFFGDILWRLRGFLDRLLGGVGLSRGRRSVQELRTGDALDFWRVLLAEANSRLILLAEMKVPGEAVLQFSLNACGSGCELIQIARFLPRGLSGLAYWYSMAPFHDYLFKGMLSTIARHCGCRILEPPAPFAGGERICRLPEHWGEPD